MDAWQYALDNSSQIGALSAAVVAALGAIGALIASLRNGAKITQIRVEIDGRLSELLRVSASLQDSRVEISRLEGTVAGRDQEMLRRAEAVATIVAAKPNNQVPQPVEIVNPEPVAVIVKEPPEKS